MAQTTSKSLNEVAEMIRVVGRDFDAANRRKWGIQGLMMELSKQVGDLSRAVLTLEGYYLPDRDTSPAYAADRDRVANELADIFYCIVRIAQHYDLDLEEAHMNARAAEWRYLHGDQVPPPWSAPLPEPHGS
jgi:NTP pyrophosphatase (non-canonical NTP hydrolase)